MPEKRKKFGSGDAKQLVAKRQRVSRGERDP
jgi:hypothetical protein